MRRYYRPVAIACLVVAFAFALVAPASARPASASSAPPRPAGGPKVPRPQMEPGWSAMELPMGSSTTGRLVADGGKIIGVPMYAGQSLHSELYGSRPTSEWLLALWNGYINDEDPLVLGRSGYPRIVNYTAGNVTGDYDDGQGEVSHTWGWYDLVIYPPNAGGTYRLNWTITDPPVTLPIGRISGSNRFATSVAAANWAFPSTDTVVIATGRNFADALAASALCGSYGAPLLLTEPSGTLPSSVHDKIQSMGAHTAFIIGSTNAITQNMQDQIDAITGVETSRVAGANRFLTAIEIARKVKAHEEAMGRTPATEAFLTSGRGFADALAVSPYAYSQRMPILLTEPNSLPSSTASAFAELGITFVNVVGGTGSVKAPVVSDAVWNQLPVAPANKYRIQGEDRTDTAVQAAGYAVGKGWADWSQVCMATGYDYPDALGGGVAAGQKGGVLLLTKPLYLTEYTWNHGLWDHYTDIDDVRLFGSWTVISGFVMGNVNEALLP